MRTADDTDVWTMNHPSAPARNGETVNKLGRDFRSRQSSQQTRLGMRTRGRQLRGALIGAVVGAAAVCVLSLLENQPLHWFSPAWEVLALGLAGYLLARSRGGFLNGLALFGVGYLLTMLAREGGYDSWTVIGHLATPRFISLHGDFATFLTIAVIGGLIGFASDRR